MSSLKEKIKKINQANKKGILRYFLYSKINFKIYNLKTKFMKRGTTPYVHDAINSELGRRYLEKEYKWYLDGPERQIYHNEKSLPKIIWWCWLQGLKKAPDMVKMCLKSVRKQFKGYKINIVTMSNINTYLHVPNYIIKKLKVGIISYAHFSDILRIMLLAKYGGVWIDSTVFCSNSKIIPIIENNDFFIYKNGLLGNDQDIRISSWFMSAKKNNLVVNDVKYLLFNYWKKHEFLENYFLVHLFFTLVFEKYPELYSKIPSYNNVSPHMMVKELNDKFSEQRYEQLDSFSSMHKLNHHIQFNNSENTLYHYLLHKYLKDNE